MKYRNDTQEKVSVSSSRMMIKVHPGEIINLSETDILHSGPSFAKLTRVFTDSIEQKEEQQKNAGQTESAAPADENKTGADKQQDNEQTEESGEQTEKEEVADEQQEADEQQDAETEDAGEQTEQQKETEDEQIEGSEA